MNEQELLERITDLEMQLSWQDETIDSLDKTVARLNETVRLQQEQLSWLYRRLENADNTAMPANEKPPHY